jgi:hypothetical protein
MSDGRGISNSKSPHNKELKPSRGNVGSNGHVFCRDRFNSGVRPFIQMATSNQRMKTYLGVPMDVDHYDDAIALTEYVWRHYLHLMTALEKRVGTYSVPIVSDSPMEKARRLYQMLEDRDGHVPDVDVHDALQLGIPAFRTRTMRRLLSEASGDLVINRCNACKRLTRTPIARQCTWCGASWHAQQSDNGTNNPMNPSGGTGVS